VGNRLAQSRRRRLPLANVLVASPCDVPWDSMEGDDRMRHCKSCDRFVHDLSAMTRDEVDAFLASAKLGSGPMPCVSLYQRADGTILTADCPVGSSRRKRALLASTLGTGLAAVLAFTALAFMALDAQPVRIEAPAPSVAFPPALPTPVEVGWLAVDAPVGSSVTEAGHALGDASRQIPLSPGAHTVRVEGPHGELQVETVYIVDRSITHLTAFATPPPRVSGGLAPPPPPTRLGGKMAPLRHDPL
jgi:hypothetical protein